MKLFKFKKPLIAAAVLCSLTAVAYGATQAIRVTVNNQSTNYRAILVNGTTYVALRDVADLTGRQVSYNARSRTVNISDGAVGGTTQRTGNEGSRGQFLTIPEASLRVDGIVHREKYGSSWTDVNGLIRNTSSVQRNYHVSDAKLVLKNGQQITKQTSASDLGGEVYARLQRGEDVKMNLQFKGNYTESEIDRVVITLSVGEYSGGPYKVFRAKF